MARVRAALRSAGSSGPCTLGAINGSRARAVAEHGPLVAELAAGVVGGASFAPCAWLGSSGVGVFGADWPVVPPSPGAPLGELPGTWAAVLAGVWLLRHVGEERAAERLEGAVGHVLAERGPATGDAGETADALVSALVAAT